MDKIIRELLTFHHFYEEFKSSSVSTKRTYVCCCHNLAWVCINSPPPFGWRHSPVDRHWPNSISSLLCQKGRDAITVPPRRQKDSISIRWKYKLLLHSYLQLQEANELWAVYQSTPTLAVNIEGMTSDTIKRSNACKKAMSWYNFAIGLRFCGNQENKMKKLILHRSPESF